MKFKEYKRPFLLYETLQEPHSPVTKKKNKRTQTKSHSIENAYKQIASFQLMVTYRTLQENQSTIKFFIICF